MADTPPQHAAEPTPQDRPVPARARAVPGSVLARSRTLRALAHPNFRLYYLGQLVSLNGTWMQRLAQAWLLYRLTESSVMLGIAGAATLAPNLVLGLVGGVVADRVSRHRLLLVAQVLAMVQALTLAGLTLTGVVAPWHIITLALVLGIVQAFEMPARHSFVAQLVPREDLPNAVALNSTSFHLARFVGPAIAGGLVAWIGEGVVFAVNGVTFIAVLAALLAMRLPASAHAAAGGREPGALVAGLRYAWGHTTIRAALSMVAVASMVGASAAVLMPVFAAEIYDSGAESLGLLLAALGVGSLTGAITLARRGSAGLERVVGGAAVAAGIALAAFGTIDRLGLALAVLPVAGFALTRLMASTNAFIQVNVPDALRGRVMSLFSVALHGAMPLGHLALGAAAAVVGAPATLVGCGVVMLVASVVFYVAIVRPARVA